jgi:hypothetical protein
MLVIVLAMFGLGIGGGIIVGLTNLWLLVLPAVLAWLVVTAYCLAKYSTDRAVISRLAYQELTNQPETVPEATQQLIPRTWGFLRLSLLVGLYLSLVFFFGYILLAIVAGICVGIVAGLNLIGNPLVIVLVSLVLIGALCLFILAIIRYYSYWFVAELPMAIESLPLAQTSIRRSRELSKSTVGRIQLIIFIAILITSPISLLGNAPSFVGQIMTNPVLFPDEKTQMLGMALVIGGTLLGLISELFVMPFWQVVKSVIYFDLRNRREGSDLIL